MVIFKGLKVYSSYCSILDDHFLESIWATADGGQIDWGVNELICGSSIE